MRIRTDSEHRQGTDDELIDELDPLNPVSMFATLLELPVGATITLKFPDSDTPVTYTVLSTGYRCEIRAEELDAVI